MKYLLVFVLGLFACQQEKITPEVFLGFKLGSPISEVTNRSNHLLGTLALKSAFGVNYHTHRIDNFLYKGVYYSTPAFTVAPGDSLVSKISVIYFDNLNYTESIKSQINSSETQLYLSTHDEGKIPASFVRDDVLSDLTLKYGQPTQESEIGIIPEWIYRWTDKNGVNIILQYSVWNSQEVKMSSLKVDFTFTQDIHEKIFPHKSPY